MARPSRPVRPILALAATIVIGTAGCTATPAGGTSSPTAVASAQPSAAGGEPIKLGTIVPLSGGVAKLGTEIANAVELAVDEWNAKGGIAGRQIVLVKQDDQCDAAQAGTAAQKIADDPDILGVVGALCSSATIPASDVLVKANVAMITPSSSSPEVTDRGLANVNRVCARDDVQGPAQAGFLKSLNVTKIAAIDDGTTGPKVNNDLMQKEAESLGISVSRYTIRAGDKDFRSVLGTIPKDVGAIVAAVYAPEAALLAQQRIEVGLKVPMISTDGSFDVEGYIAAAGGAAEGNYVTFLAPDINKIPSAKAFFDAYTPKYGAPASYGPLAYDAANIILTAIEKDGSFDRAGVMKAVRETASFASILGQPITFDDKGDVEGAQIYVYQVKGSKFEFVKPVSGG